MSGIVPKSVTREQFIAELKDDLQLAPLVPAWKAEAKVDRSLSILIRYHGRGLRGIRLRCQRVAGRWYTCRLWVREFIEATNLRAGENMANRSAMTITSVAGREQARKLEADRAAELLRKKVGG